MTTYTSRDGKQTEVSNMAEPHLKSALAKLREQESVLLGLVDGTAPAGIIKAFWKGEQTNKWSPARTPGEILLRTRYWIDILSTELKRRDDISWHGIADDPILNNRRK